MHTSDVLVLVDWHLLALFVGLFVIGRGLEVSGCTVTVRSALPATGVDLAQPARLVLAVSFLGLMVGNLPAVMLLLPFVPREPTGPATRWRSPAPSRALRCWSAVSPT